MADTAQERIGLLEQRLAREPQSPLFARLASLYVGVGRAQDALRLCDDGLAHYPFYATAHLVKGKALSELGMLAEARHEFEVVLELLPTSETVARLVSSIDVGTPAEHASAPVTEVSEEPPVQPETDQATEAPIEPSVVEEVPQPIVEDLVEEIASAPGEPVAMEEPVQPAEEPVVEEGAQEIAPTEAAPVANDLAGFGETAAEEATEAEPSAAEKLGLEMKRDAMEPLTDTGFGAGFGEAAPAEEETAFAMPAQEEPPAADDSGSAETFGTASVPVEEPILSAAPAEHMPETADPLAEYAPKAEQQKSPEIATSEPAIEHAVATEPTAAESENPDWYDAFSQLQQPPAEAEQAPPVTAPTEEENPFAMFGAEQPAAAPEGEAYEEYTARVRMEMFGNEDKMTLEEYLEQAAQAESSASPSDSIGDLAEKLKSSPRITPPVINFSEKASRSSSEVDAAASSGFVTPTLAEIYVKQGWLDDAIKAYRSLAANKPAEREKFEQRISEIEEMKKSP